MPMQILTLIFDGEIALLSIVAEESSFYFQLVWQPTRRHAQSCKWRGVLDVGWCLQEVQPSIQSAIALLMVPSLQGRKMCWCQISAWLLQLQPLHRVAFQPQLGQAPAPTDSHGGVHSHTTTSPHVARHACNQQASHDKRRR